MRALSVNVKITLKLKRYVFSLSIGLRETPAAEENTTAHTFTTCLHMIIYEHGVTRYPAHSASLSTEHYRQGALFSSQFRVLFVLVSILK